MKATERLPAQSFSVAIQITAIEQQLLRMLSIMLQRVDLILESRRQNHRMRPCEAIVEQYIPAIRFYYG